MLRSELRIADLKQRQPRNTRVMNVRVAVHVDDAISALAKKLDTSKTDIVLALLNAGLERGHKAALQE